MKKNKLILWLLLVAAGLYACDKNKNFEAQGGELPTHYIEFKDSAFTPRTTSVANGSNFTFLNNTPATITIVGDDTTILKSVSIGSHLSYFFKPDTIPATPIPIYIPFHCVEYPSARGLIILNP